MGKVHKAITGELQAFILRQHMFFVATAALTGRVNISPKGLDSFRILSDSRVAYLDLTGSGNETSAHLLENGRITFMFCSFEGAPRILRLYGKGQTVLPGDAEWDDLVGLFPYYLGTRQIIVADIDRVYTACGFAVPLYDYQGERDALIKWAEHRGGDGVLTYQRENNSCSIDGLPTAIGQREAQ